MIVILIEKSLIFFRFGTQWPKNYSFSTLISVPPFWTLSLPSNLASKSHTNIFLWWPKSIYFCNSSLFLSLNQKKKLKKSTKKEKFPKNKRYHPWGRRKKRFVSDKKLKNLEEKKNYCWIVRNQLHILAFSPEFGNPLLSPLHSQCDLFCC